MRPSKLRLRHRSIVRSGLLVSLVAVLLTTLGPSTGAQSTPEPNAASDIRTISVAGEGIVRLDPDTANVSLTVQSISKSLKTAQDNVTEGLASVTGVLTGAGVAADDIVTASYDIYPQNEYDDNGNFEGISGFTVSASLAVTIRDIDTVGTILDAAITGGATGVNGISFYTDDPSSPASKARALAVTDARAKADELATAAGVRIVGVNSIGETSAPPPQPYEYEAADGAMSSGAAEARQVPISPGQSEIRVDVRVVFEIEPASN